MKNIKKIQRKIGMIKSIKLHSCDVFIEKICNGLLFEYEIELKKQIDIELKYINNEINYFISKNDYVKASELNKIQRELLNIYLNIFE